jgi:hypothetical protein
MIIREYPKSLEAFVYKSLLKMKVASHHGIIDYVLLKAKKCESIERRSQH